MTEQGKMIQRSRAAARRAKAIADGRCASCASPSPDRAPKPGRSRCSVCLSKSTEARKSRDPGMCAQCCTRPAREDRKLCVACAGYQTKYKLKMTALGRCSQCGSPKPDRKPDPGKSVCPVCLSKFRSAYQKTQAKQEVP